MTAATFPSAYPVHVGSSKSNEFRTLENEFGDGYEQSAADGINIEKKTYPLVWNNISQTDADVITDFLDAQGGHLPFYWTPPNETQALFRCRKWNTNFDGGTTGSVSATFMRWYGGTP
jgi:phage-related protein